MRLPRTACALTLTAVLAVGLSACAKDDTSSGGSSDKAASSNAADSQNSDSGSGNTGSDEGVKLISDMTSKMSGKSYDFAMTIGGNSSVKGSMDPSDPKNPKMKMTMETGGQKIEEIVTDGALYVNLGAMSQNKYVKYDTKNSSDEKVKQMLSSANSADAAAQLKAMEPAITSVKKSGSKETIDGVPCQPYDINIDLTKATGAIKDQLDNAQSQLEKSGSSATVPTTISYTYFVGDDGYPRRMVYTIMGTKATMDMTNYGTKVDVQAPPADQVIDASQLAASMGQS